MPAPDWNAIGAMGQWASAFTTVAAIAAGALISRWIVLRTRPRLEHEELRFESIRRPDGTEEMWVHLPLLVRSKLEPARDVEPHLIYAYDFTTHRRLEFGELNLKWNRRDDLKLDLPPAFRRQVDIACRVAKPSEQAFIFLPLIREHIADWPATRRHLQERYRLGAGRYRLTIAVTARNADPVYYEITLDFDGRTLRCDLRNIRRADAEAHGQVQGAHLSADDY